MRKRILSMLLAALMIFSLLPMASLADAAETEVAKIDNVGFTTLQAAVDAAKDGETVTLLANVELNSTYIKITKGITIDFGEFVVSGVYDSRAPQALFDIAAGENAVTFKGTTGGVTCIQSTYGTRVAHISANSKLIIDSGVYNSIDNNTIYGDNAGASFEMRGGIINTNATKSSTGNDFRKSILIKGDVTISGGTINNNVPTSLNAYASAICVKGSNATVSISGGEINTKADRGFVVGVDSKANNVKVNITGGTAKTEGTRASLVDGNSSSNVTIKNVDFTAKGLLAYAVNGAGSASIEGGSFSNDNNTNFAKKINEVLATDSRTSVNGKTYTKTESGDVEEVLPVAKIGEKEFYSFEDAVKAATEGNVVEIVAEGTYKMCDIPTGVTVKSTVADNVDGTKAVVLDCSEAGKVAALKVATFENVAIKFGAQTNGFGGNNTYHGFHESATLTFNKCDFYGEIWTYADSFICNDCNFYQKKVDGTNLYSLYVYGSDLVKLTGCTFDVEGKAVKIAKDGDPNPVTVIADNCAFNSSIVNKNAFMYDTQYSQITVIVNECTFNECFTNEGCEGGASPVWDEYYDTGKAKFPSATAVGKDIELDENNKLIGGTFTVLESTTVGENDGIDELIPVGYEMVENEDGTYGVEAYPESVPATAKKVADGFYQDGATYKTSNNFYITSKKGLEYFRDIVNGKAALDTYIASAIGSGLTRSDARFGGKTVNLVANIDLEDEEWEPIGVYGDKDVFCGTFNGNDNTIKNLKVTYSGTEAKKHPVGLFGYMKFSTTLIENLTLENVTIDGYDYVGALVGAAEGKSARIENCTVKGDIDIHSDANYVGAIAGHTYNTFKNCSVIGNDGSKIYSDSGWCLGGIVGYLGSSATSNVSGCSVKNISISGTYHGTGAVVGIANGDNTISDCSSDSVELVLVGTNNDYGLGGIIGETRATSVTVKDSTVTGSTVKYGDNEAKAAPVSGDNIGTVGSNFELDESGKIIGGTFQSIPASMIGTGYSAYLQEDGSYKVEKTRIAKVGDTEFTSFAEAFKALSPDHMTVTLLVDLTDTGPISLPEGVTLDGDDHKISGASSVYINPKGGTVTNVNFEELHNAKGQQSAIYAESLAGIANITGCTFKNCDWDAIQIIPVAGAQINITGNTFKVEDGKSQQRFVHIQSDKNVDFDANVTGNKMFGSTKQGALEGYYFTEESTVDFSGNYIEDTSNVCILEGSGTNAAEKILPLKNAELTTDITYVAMIKDAYCVQLFENLAEAFAAAQPGDTVELLADIDLKDSNWTPVEKFSGVFNGHGYTISNMTVVDPTNHGGYTGFIREFNGTIKNVTFDKANLTGNRVGVVVGSNSHLATFADSAIIENVTVKNSVVNGVQKCGSIIGFVRGEDVNVKNVTIAGCSAENVNFAGEGGSGIWQTGGLIGYVQNSANLTVTNGSVKNISIIDANTKENQPTFNPLYASGGLIGCIDNKVSAANADKYSVNITGCSASEVTGPRSEEGLSNALIGGYFNDSDAAAGRSAIIVDGEVLANDLLNAQKAAVAELTEFMDTLTNAKGIVAAAIAADGAIAKATTAQQVRDLVDLTKEAATAAEGANADYIAKLTALTNDNSSDRVNDILKDAIAAIKASKDDEDAAKTFEKYVGLIKFQKDKDDVVSFLVNYAQPNPSEKVLAIIDLAGSDEGMVMKATTSEELANAKTVYRDMIRKQKESELQAKKEAALKTLNEALEENAVEDTAVILDPFNAQLSNIAYAEKADLKVLFAEVDAALASALKAVGDQAALELQAAKDAAVKALDEAGFISDAAGEVVKTAKTDIDTAATKADVKDILDAAMAAAEKADNALAEAKAAAEKTLNELSYTNEAAAGIIEEARGPIQDASSPEKVQEIVNDVLAQVEKADKDLAEYKATEIAAIQADYDNDHGSKPAEAQQYITSLSDPALSPIMQQTTIAGVDAKVADAKAYLESMYKGFADALAAAKSAIDEAAGEGTSDAVKAIAETYKGQLDVATSADEFAAIVDAAKAAIAEQQAKEAADAALADAKSDALDILNSIGFTSDEAKAIIDAAIAAVNAATTPDAAANATNGVADNVQKADDALAKAQAEAISKLNSEGAKISDKTSVNNAIAAVSNAKCLNAVQSALDNGISAINAQYNKENPPAPFRIGGFFTTLFTTIGKIVDFILVIFKIF